MIFEPPIDRPALVEFLRSTYGIAAEGVEFVPVGMVASCYRVECAADAHGQRSRFFARLLGSSRLARQNAARLGFYLPICQKLHELGLGVAYPLRTRSDQLVTRFADCDVVLYPNFEGRTLGDVAQRPLDVQLGLAEAVAQLHSLTPRLGLDACMCPYVERFAPSWRGTLLASLDALSSLPHDSRAGQLSLRDLLVPKRDQLVAMLNRMEELGRAAQAFSSPLVLTHTDLTGSNILLDSEGRLILLDWEGAMLAPAEHDLFLFVGRGFDEFLRAYGRRHALRPLHADTFGYYLYHRNLADLTDWLVTILCENTTDAQDRQDLADIQHDCLSAWPRLETDIKRVGRQLGRIGAASDL